MSISPPVFAVTGITGQVGGVVARTLLDAGQSVRAVVRNANKAAAWGKQGCQVAIAEMSDAVALTAAFSGADAVFVLLPPIFAPAPSIARKRKSSNSGRMRFDLGRCRSKKSMTSDSLSYGWMTSCRPVFAMSLDTACRYQFTNGRSIAQRHNRASW